MSALEPDAPAPHVFPHWREAIRAWWAHRKGAGASRPALGAVRGKGPTVGDLLRVGQVLADLQLLTGGEVTPMGRRVVECALMGGAGRRADRAIQAATKRLERHLRRRDIVASCRHLGVLSIAFEWTDDDGETHRTSSLVDFP